MKIFFATDGSDYSVHAARFLSRFRFTPDDEITIFHAISWVPFKDDRESHYASLRKIKQEIAPRILDSATNILKSTKARISTALAEGSPDREIVDAAEEASADLIAMGARGLRGIKSLIAGSVTRAVVINSTKPVFIAKMPPWETAEKLKVLFTTDGSEQAVATCRLLAAMPFPENSEITILHAIWTPFSDIPERFVMEVEERIKESVARARSVEYAESEKIIDQAKGILGARFGSIEALTKVGDPSVEILKQADTIKADIVAAGSRGLRGVKGMMGSVSRNIVAHAACSVLIGK